jgi:hypothetical protein
MSMSMSPTEHTPKTPRSATGIFALLGALLRVKGTGASKITQGTGAPKAGRVRLLTLAWRLTSRGEEFVHANRPEARRSDLPRVRR